MTSTQPIEQQAPSPIPTPPDFPVSWERPEEAQWFWKMDRMHFPDPLPVLAAEFMRRSMAYGWTPAAADYQMPLRLVAKRINTYWYDTAIPTVATPDEAEAMGQHAQELIAAVMGQLEGRWRDDWLPEIRRHLDFWAGFDLPGASLAELRAHLGETIARYDRLWRLHFDIVFPCYLAMSLFDELYRDLFGDEGAFDGYRLLEGFGNQTVESGHALWRLSRRALAVPEVRRIVEERDPAEVMAALAASEAGRAFLAQLRAYLHDYGQRGDKFSLADRSWIEDPTPVLKNLKDYLAQPDRDLEGELAALAGERERLVAETRARLAGYPQPVVAQFESLLKAAQVGTILSEDHGFWIDYRGTYRVRRVLLECGRRLAAAGALAAAEDVFHLTIAEVQDALAALPDGDLRALVDSRKAEIAHFRAVTPPPALGTPPPGPPPDTAATRANLKFFGGPPQAQTEPGVLRGSPGSPGAVRGRVKIVRALAEASKLEPGDVLVTETTAPPWTPLFATAAAVVTETGGVLSHCAVVAREYRIPAVVGATAATTLLRDGMVVEVDGDAGIIRFDPAD